MRPDTRAAAVDPHDRQVGPAVVVQVAPGHGAGVKAQSAGGQRESTGTVVVIDSPNPGARAGTTGQRQVHGAIVVVVAPGQARPVNLREGIGGTLVVEPVREPICVKRLLGREGRAGECSIYGLDGPVVSMSQVHLNRRGKPRSLIPQAGNQAPPAGGGHGGHDLHSVVGWPARADCSSAPLPWSGYHCRPSTRSPGWPWCLPPRSCRPDRMARWAVCSPSACRC